MKAKAPTWRPPMPLRDMAPECLEYAENLRRALAATWPRLADSTVQASQVEEYGCADYRRVFGHEISPRHWRRAVGLVMERGGGKGADADLLAAYLPKRIRARREPESELSAVQNPDLQELAAALAAVQDIGKPNATEKAWLWDQVFQHFEGGLASGKPERAWKRTLIEWLAIHAPGLAGSEASLRHLWGSKITDWREAGGDIQAIRDKRSRSRSAPALPAEDRDRITAAAVLETDGNLAGAYRLVRERGQLSLETAERFTANPSRKSDTPKAVRREIAPMLPSLANYHRGPRTARLNGAYLTRDWSGVASGDWYQGDDCTLPVAYYIPSDDWFQIIRGQCLVMIDLRSRRILDLVLVDHTAYESIQIRRLMNRVCDRFGVPRRGFYFEGGLWERSKVVTGGKAKPAFGPAEIESGFKALGIEFRHARTPRAKPVERVLGAMQDLMAGVPGYVGRNEMVDRFERIHRARLDVDARRKHPAEAGFLDGDAWFERLGAICETYNRTAMESEATEGLSPDDAWEKFQRQDDPLVMIPREARHLLATHCSVVKVGRTGVKVGPSQRFCYRSEATGNLIGQTVMVHFDTDAPEFCTITDLERRNPVLVPREVRTPGAGVTAAEMAAGMSSVHAHERPIRERYSRIRCAFQPATRGNLVAREVVDLGRQMTEQRSLAVEETRRLAKERGTIRKALSEVLPGQDTSALAAEAAADPERAGHLRRLAGLLAD